MSTTLTVRRGVIDRYRTWLPVTEATPVITLGEGSTPLVPAQVLSEELGCEVWLHPNHAHHTAANSTAVCSAPTRFSRSSRKGESWVIAKT